MCKLRTNPFILVKHFMGGLSNKDQPMIINDHCLAGRPTRVSITVRHLIHHAFLWDAAQTGSAGMYIQPHLVPLRAVMRSYIKGFSHLSDILRSAEGCHLSLQIVYVKIHIASYLHSRLYRRHDILLRNWYLSLL